MLNQQGEQNKQLVIDLAEQRFEKKLTEESATLSSKFESKLSHEVYLIRNEMADLKIHIENRLTEEIGALRGEMVRGEQSLREEMIRGDESIRKEIAEKHANTIKWMFVFWVGQIGVITGILLIVVK
jgi:hypothetical protein